MGLFAPLKGAAKNKNKGAKTLHLAQRKNGYAVDMLRHARLGGRTRRLLLKVEPDWSGVWRGRGRRAAGHTGWFREEAAGSRHYGRGTNR